MCVCVLSVCAITEKLHVLTAEIDAKLVIIFVVMSPDVNRF